MRNFMESAGQILGVFGVNSAARKIAPSGLDGRTMHGAVTVGGE